MNGQLEQAVQHLYTLELFCDREPPVSLSPNAPTYHLKPRRDAVAAATIRIQQEAAEDW